MRYRTYCMRLGTVLAAASILATTAFAQSNTCTQDEYNSFNGTHKTLSCTANDVSIAGVVPRSINVFSGGIPNSDKCVSGGSFSFTAEFNISTSSSSARSNIGIFFAGGSQTQAKTGTCSSAILSQSHPCAGDSSISCGSSQYEELDQSINGETAAANGCGDTSSSDGGGTGIQQSVLEVDNVTCPTTAPACPSGIGLDGQTCLALPYCTSWYQPAKGMPVCESPTWSWVSAAIPGTSSKCDCGLVYVPVQPVQPAISVAKSCDIGSDTTANQTLCHAGAEGNTVTYTVTVTNTTPAGEGGVIIDQICDDQYGSIYRSNNAPNTLAACPAVAIASVSPTFGSCTTFDVTTAAAACTFTVTHGENLSVTDKATVYGHSDFANTGTSATPETSNTVTVDSTDAPTTVSTSLSNNAPTFACVTLPYTVTVQNTSSADESVILAQVGTFGVTGYVPALNDSITFGDVTRTHGNAAMSGSVTSTTCGQAGGGGAFPQTLAPGTGTAPTTDGGKYTCTFNGVICGTPNSTNVANCAAGLTAQSQINPNLTGDDAAPNADTITVTAHTFTAGVCLVQSGS